MDIGIQYWDEQYVQKYMGDSFGDLYLSQVDSAVLYEGLDSLAIKVAGETTGVEGMDWFKSIEAPDIRSPFSAMVTRDVIK